MAEQKNQVKFGLGKKLFIFILFIILSLLFVVYNFTLRDESEALKEQLRLRGMSIAKTVANSVSTIILKTIAQLNIKEEISLNKPKKEIYEYFDKNPSIMEMFLDLQDILQAQPKNEDILWVSVIDPFGRVISHSDPDISYLSPYKQPKTTISFKTFLNVKSIIEENIDKNKEVISTLLPRKIAFIRNPKGDIEKYLKDLGYSKEEADKIYDMIIDYLEKENSLRSYKARWLFRELLSIINKYQGTDIFYSIRPLLSSLLKETRKVYIDERNLEDILKKLEEVISSQPINTADKKLLGIIINSYISTELGIKPLVQFYDENVGSITKKRMMVVYPILLRGDINSYVGEVQIGISLSGVEMAISMAEMKLQFAALIAILAGLVFVIALVRFITNPVRKIVRGMEEVGRGNLEVHVMVKTQDELELIANTFNNMVEGLREKERMRDIMNKVVSKEIAEELMKRGINLGGEERVVTMLFSDIRGFTSMSEKMSPPEIVSILNEYMTEMVEIINKYRGVVDKFVGDEIMVIYGAPLSYGEVLDAKLAVATAVDMIKRVKELHQKWEKEGKPLLTPGIGINTGVVVAGNMGSRDRLSYTVIGDAVNTASRLCSSAGKLQILISETTYNLVKEFVKVNELEPIKVKGKEKPLKVYEVLDYTASPLEELKELATL